ncbi:STAS domain-containing protein [Desulfonema magnum]|uniref:STAS domain-containing protein n=1 Tax=Desulfonema magnum TaxID=45655 RepID=A0A975BM57_9BACT|nr:STAS domain-containing protein [Desulfonema magnum]QTA88051.1 STAS domain-containing protein [Desulfonema magnum]
MGEVTILNIGNNIIVPVQTELHDEDARQLQTDILKKIENTGAKGLLIDVSAVSIIDSFLGRLLVETSKMARLMGTETVLVGMKKEVVLTLIQLGLQMKNLHTALNIEDGLALLEKMITGPSLSRRKDEKFRK